MPAEPVARRVSSSRGSEAWRAGARRRGVRGERLAASYLRGLGYRIVRKNFRTRRAEVDLIAVDGNELVFVEVKTWRTLPLEGLEHALDGRKQRRIAAAARSFLAGAPASLAHRQQRFDVLLLRDAGPPHHVVGAFEP